VRRLLASCALALAATITIGGVGPLIADASASTVVLPTVSGGFGVTPKLAFPNSAAPSGLQAKVLSKGSGPAVVKGDLLISNYLGQIWRGKVFDSSFSRKETFGIPIGVGAVVKGWDQGLVGLHIGSRVLLSVPPALGYGSSGNSAAGIKGTDTLVFVIDLVAQYSKSVGANQKATAITSGSGGVSVKNITSTKPTITVAKNTAKPTAESVTLLARGTQAKVVPGMIVLQYLVEDWTGKALQSTWTTGSPDGEYVGMAAVPNVFDKLVGDPIGSRVLMKLPANSNGGPYAVVAQIAAEVPAKASKP
jgi:peptidylprolyl isomerase